MVLVGLSMVTILVLVVTRPRGRDTDTSELGPRLDSVNQTLGRLSLVSESMLDVGQELRKVLSAPTLRGGLGETLLEEMLSQTLPAGSYRTQHTFRNLRRVDAVIQLSDGLVPVDAKFPFEGYRAMVESDPSERKSHKARFNRDVKKHIDDIAERYICPGETLDFALMYIPNEGVYHEIVQQDGEREDLLAYAWSRRIIATSPNSLYAYLQVISLGLRGLQVEQNARSMLESLSRLEGDFERFAEDFRLVGTHLSRAKAKYDEGLPRLDSIQRGLPGRRYPVSPVDALEDREQPWKYGGSRPDRGRPTDHAPD